MLTVEQIQKQTEHACNGDFHACYYTLRNKACNMYMNPRMQGLAKLYLQASLKYKQANMNHKNRNMHACFTDFYRH